MSRSVIAKLSEIRGRELIGRDWLNRQHSFDLPDAKFLAIVTSDELTELCDLAHDYEFDVNVPLAELREENTRLRAALEELLDVAVRARGGDPKLDPESWYAARDYARNVLARGE